MIDRAHAVWTNGNIPGALLIDIKAACPSMAKGMRVNIVKDRKIDGHLIQWMESCLLGRTVDMTMDGNGME
jgi:hypothetical protein